MKHLIKTIVVVAAVLLAAGCNKETLPTPQPADQTRHVGYVKCGEPGSATVTGEEAWHALLDTLFDATLEGCAITFWDADLAGTQPSRQKRPLPIPPPAATAPTPGASGCTTKATPSR